MASEIKQEGVTEDLTHGWYKNRTPEHPSQGVTEPAFTHWDTEEKYTWTKAPRYQELPMQTGPLARMAVAYA